MQNFQQILAEAAKLKESQLKRQRKEYQSLPEFIKSGLAYSKKYSQVRKQHFLFQLRVSRKLKDQGNVKFGQQSLIEALAKYEEALSIFRYIHSRNYQDMKDEDMTYICYNSTELSEQHQQALNSHLSAVYLNICSVLTKLNRKNSAIYSADEALSVSKTAKGHYRKGQAYLRWINRDQNDIKLGLLQLKQAYNLSQDHFILQEMITVKQQYEQQKQKQKQCFRSMFDRNTKQNSDKIEKQLKCGKQVSLTNQQQANEKRIDAMIDAERTQPSNKNSKQKLNKYMEMHGDSWVRQYQQDFVKKYGSKLYWILKIYGYENQANQYRLLLARCLEEDTQKSWELLFGEWMDWMRKHPLPKIIKYLHKFDVQIQYIRNQRQNSKIWKDRLLCQSQSKPVEGVKQDDLKESIRITQQELENRSHSSHNDQHQSQITPFCQQTAQKNMMKFTHLSRQFCYFAIVIGILTSLALTLI